MVLESRLHKDQIEKSTLHLYKHNRRKLKIALEKNCISKEHYSQIKTQLDNELNSGFQPPIEDLFDSLQLISIADVMPIINRELFRYNQIVIKLALQFSINTTTQQLKLQNIDAVSIQKANKKLQDTFSKILKDMTNDYLAGHQINIDNTLLESGCINESNLDFLHKSAEHLEIKAQDRKFGEIAVKNEFTTQDIVNKALDQQTELYKKTSKNHIIGDILVEQKHISPETRNEILIIQNRIMEEDWEETLKEVGQSSIDEKEKNAMFGALIIKEHLLDERQIVEALKIQARELEEYRKRAKEENIQPDISDRQKGESVKKTTKPRWIGDILVEDFGLSERDRKRIVKKQMEYKIERINLKLGLNLSNAHIELFNEMQQYFELSYSKNKVEAYIKVIKPIPKTMTKDNMIIWLYNKKISYGRIISAIESLISNKVKPGKKILLAKGDEAVPAEMQYKFHFNIKPYNNAPQSGTNQGDILSRIVSKGVKLVTFRKTKGKSGLNVNHCFVAPPMVTPINIVKGENVTRNENSFIASCDGLPHFSNNREISVSSVININGDITPENMPENSTDEFDCDFNIQGSVQDGISLKCRKLKASALKGKVIATDDVTIVNDTVNSEIDSKGNIHLASVENSVVDSGKSIFIELHSNESNIPFNKIYNSIITSNDIIKISDAKAISSIIRGKNKIILKKVTVGENCKFIVGDSIETIASKKRSELISRDIDKIEAKIKDVQEKSRELFDKIEKKDIAAIDQEIKTISKNQRTKSDLDRIADLRVMKRQKEKEYEASIDKYGSLFMQHSQMIKQYQEHKNILEKEQQEIKNRIIAIYKKEEEIPELDIRHSMLPAGTVIQFRYNKQVIKIDCEGFVFREEFNRQTNLYELKQHRW